jgi:hypothetical protein
MAKVTLEELIDIAFAVEDGDPFDWGSFKQGKTEAMKMIGTSILDQFDKDVYTDNERLVILATLTKLVTENMILHSKLLTQSQKESKI